METFNYYIDALKKYAKFDGRANRAQFWYFVLFNFIISILLGMISKNIGSLYSLLVFIPGLAIGARRLHDLGKSGWWQLVSLIPLIGIIWLIILFIKKGDAGENQYGLVGYSLSINSSLKEGMKDFSEKAKDLGKTVSRQVEKTSDKIEEKVKDITDEAKK